MAATDFNSAVSLTLQLANAYQAILEGSDTTDVLTPGGTMVPSILKVEKAVRDSAAAITVDAAASAASAATHDAAALVSALNAAVSATAAVAAARTYVSTSAGIAATTSGQAFLVTTVDPQMFNLYTNTSGSAVLIGPMSILSKAYVDAAVGPLSAIVTAVLVPMPAESGYVSGIMGFDADGVTSRLALGVQQDGTVAIFKISLPLGCVELPQLGSTATALMWKPLAPESGYSFSLEATDPDGVTIRYALAVDLVGNVIGPRLSAGSAAILSSPAGISDASYTVFQRKDANGYWQLQSSIKAQANKRVVLTTGNSNKTDPHLTPDGYVLYWDDGVAPGIPNQQYVKADGTSAAPHATVCGKRVRCIGDSIAFGTGTTNAATKGPPAILAGLLGSSWTVTAEGIPSQRCYNIASRVGAIATTCSVASNQIPASGAVAVTILSQLPDPTEGLTYPAGAGPLAFKPSSSLPCSIAGIAGTLNTDSGAAYSFTRTVAGSITACPPGTNIIIDQQGKDDYMYVVEGGRNSYTQTARVRANMAACFNSMLAYDRRGIFHGTTKQRNGAEDTGSTASNAIDANNAYWAALFPNNFIDIQAQLMANGLTLVGLTPTSQDTTDIAAGRIPQSLMAVDNLHPNDYGSQAIGILDYNFAVSKGWTL